MTGNPLNKISTMRIPATEIMPEIVLDISNIKEAEHRLIEAKVVNGATYSELEYTFNEGYRQAKKHLSTIMYQISMAEKQLRKVKSEYLLDDYPEFLKEKKMKDSVAVREAYLETKPDYAAATDRIAMLKAMECLFEGKVKVFENVCRYMRKTIDIQLRSGVIDHNKYMR